MSRGKPKGSKKTGGRQAGTPNRTTVATKQLIQDILNEYLDKLHEDLDKLSAKDRVNALLGLIPYIVPKKQATEAKVNIDRLSGEEISALAGEILTGMGYDEDNTE